LTVYVPAAARDRLDERGARPNDDGADRSCSWATSHTRAPENIVPKLEDRLSAMRWFTEPVKVSVPFWPAAVEVTTVDEPLAVIVPVVSLPKFARLSVMPPVFAPCGSTLIV
jgi:hypothetical protein